MPELSNAPFIRSVLDLDRPWTALALADTDPKYSADARWFAAPGPRSPLVLLYLGLPRPLIMPIGPLHADLAPLLDEVSAALDAAGPVEAVLRPDLLPLVERRYQILHCRRMLRMVLAADTVLAPPAAAVRLTTNDHAAVGALYADGEPHGEAPDAFMPAMLEHGVFYGVAEAGHLVAAAGTHVIAPTVGVAAIGNVYTRRGHRGRGHGAVVTAQVVAAVLALGCKTVVLNVRSDNASAIRVYHRLGFVSYCEFFETVVAPSSPGTARAHHLVSRPGA